MGATVESLNEQMISIEAKTDQQTTLLEKIDHAVNGNGKPGLKTEMILVKASLEKCRDAQKLHSKIIWTIVALVSGIVSWVAGSMIVIWLSRGH